MKNGRNNLKICEWNPNGDDIEHAVPALYEAIKGFPEWRAIIVTYIGKIEAQYLDARNPYDQINESESDQVKKIKESHIPLVRLTHMLAGFPPLGVIGYEMGYSYFNEQSGQYEDCYFDNGNPVLQKEFDYLPEDEKEIIKKKYGGELKTCLMEIGYKAEQKAEHKKLVKKYVFNENRPVEILLLCARELIEQEDDTVKRIWEFRSDEDSSNFWQKYNFPNNCRFLYFYVRNPNHTLYLRDIWCFWLLTITLAINQLPGTSLQAYQLYKTELDIDPDMLGKIYEDYIKKLLSVQAAIKDFLMTEPELTQEKKADIVPSQTVIVNYDYVEDSRIMVPTSRIGLAADCPIFETEFWDEYIYKTKKTLEQVFSEPQEVIASKADDTHQKINSFYGREQVLDRFQYDIILKRINELEPNVMNTKVYNTIDTIKYKEEIRKAGVSVRKYLNCRITKRNILNISLISFFVFLGGFIPYLINSIKISATVFRSSLTLTGFAIIMLGLGGMIILGFLRKQLINKLKDFNKNLRKILDSLNESAQVFSDYFSGICTYMYARSLLSGVTFKNDNDYSFGKMLKNHHKMIDNEMKAKQFICSLYNKKLDLSFIKHSEVDHDIIKELPAESYLYELNPNDDIKTLRLGNTGELLDAPYSFIIGIDLKREEIYKKNMKKEHSDIL